MSKYIIVINLSFLRLRKMNLNQRNRKTGKIHY